ncbi:hypothetical protein [Bradyrhizobium sp. URHC0002]
MGGSAADAVTGDDAWPVAWLRGLLSNRFSLPDRLDFACAGRLQQGEARACGFLRIQIALPFVLDLQAGPFIRIDGLEVGSFELAIGVGLRRQQRQVRPPDFWFGISVWFGVSADAYGSPDGRRFAFVQRQRRTGFTLRRIARTTGK